MKESNILHKIKWGTYVFFSEIYDYAIIGKTGSLSIYSSDGEIVLCVGFKHTNFAIESKKHKKLFVKSTTGQICAIDYATNQHKTLRRKIGEGYTAFISHDEDYVFFISWTLEVLAVNIATLEQTLCYDIKEIFGAGRIKAFLKKSCDTPGYIFTGTGQKSAWDDAANSLFFDVDLFARTYNEIYMPLPLAAPYQNNPICKHIYIPELDGYVLLYRVGAYADLTHIKLIKDSKEVFCFDSGLFALSTNFKVFHREAQQIYIALSPETIILFDFGRCKITKIFKSAYDIADISYNKRADELVLIYLYGSGIAAMDDFDDFPGFG